jgi:predicted acetyltransferase
MEFSELESKRFGLQVYRGILSDLDDNVVEKTANFIENNLVDVLILRVPADFQFQIYKLQNLGYPVIFADTLVYYIADLSQEIEKGLKNNDLSFEPCVDSDKDLIGDLVEEIFQNYTNHYFSNPLLPKKDILEGYKEWAKNFIQDDETNKKAWLIKKDNQCAGFVTCSIENDTGEVVLGGVKTFAKRGGIYSDLIRFSKNYFIKKNIKKVKVSTQVQNYAVQKVWSREGFYLNNAYVTLHLNIASGRGLKSESI